MMVPEIVSVPRAPDEDFVERGSLQEMLLQVMSCATALETDARTTTENKRQATPKPQQQNRDTRMPNMAAR